MKSFSLFTLLLAFFFANAQSLPIDFENGITTDDFIDFDGGTATVLPNPEPSGINTSSTVAQIVRNGGEVWSGSKIALAENLDFSDLNTISMKIFTDALPGTTIKFKLETPNGSTERDVLTTVSGEWETLKWDFTGVPADFNEIVFMFDFGWVGDGSIRSTFLFDDIEQFFGGKQLDLPVDFEASDVNYSVTDFGGNSSSLVADPTDPNNMVIETIKTELAVEWAGTTIGTPGGFASDIPLSLTDSKMSVKVWSPEAGTPIRLKVEDSNDPTRTCETETNTTVSEAWEIIEFDFLNEAPGTQSLSVGLNQGWRYNMASIFFNFGTNGFDAGEKTYYFDDVKFGTGILAANDFELQGLSVFPNPSADVWNIQSENADIDFIEIFDLQGKSLLKLTPQSRTAAINTTRFSKGIYFSKISTEEGIGVVKLLKK